jgi:hypothetical protein
MRRLSGNVAVAASDKCPGYEALCWFPHNYRPPKVILGWTYFAAWQTGQSFWITSSVQAWLSRGSIS